MRFFTLFASTKLQHFVLFLAIGVTSLANAADFAPKVASPAIAKTPTVQPVNVKPLWTTLTSQQKLTLAPLAFEWDKMDEVHKKKWLEIANKYASMKPDEQVRVQETLEDAPFYARSMLSSGLLGEKVISMHETLNVPRLTSLMVRMMLPFRMPRRK